MTKEMQSVGCHLEMRVVVFICSGGLFSLHMLAKQGIDNEVPYVGFILYFFNSIVCFRVVLWPRSLVGATSKTWESGTILYGTTIRETLLLFL